MKKLISIIIFTKNGSVRVFLNIFKVKNKLYNTCVAPKEPQMIQKNTV